MPIPDEVIGMPLPAWVIREADRPDDRDLQPVEDPGRAQAEDDAPVKPAPGQPVKTRGNLGLDDPEFYSSHGAALPPGVAIVTVCSAAGSSATATASGRRGP